MSFIRRVGKFFLGESIGVNSGNKQKDNFVKEIYEQGVELLVQEKYGEALKYFNKAAKFGHTSAKYNQALMLFNGLGDYPNFELARQLFQEAKSAGHTRCDEFLIFMQEVDEVMLFKEAASISPQEIYVLQKNNQKAFERIIQDPEKQAGRLIYLISSFLQGIISGNHFLAEGFIKNELNAMQYGNDISIKYLKDLNLNSDLFESNFNEVSQVLDNLWFDLIKASGGTLSLDNLVYTRCCIVNEIIKKCLNDLLIDLD